MRGCGGGRGANQHKFVLQFYLREYDAGMRPDARRAHVLATFVPPEASDACIFHSYTPLSVFTAQIRVHARTFTMGPSDTDMRTQSAG